MTMQKMFGVAAAAFMAAAVVSLTAGPASANLVTNGDFSANAGSYGTNPGYSAGFTAANPAAPTGRSITLNYPIGINGPDTGFYASKGSPFAPGNVSGVRDFAFLQDASGYTGSAIFQAISTISGQMYTLSYVAAQRGTSLTNSSATMETLVIDAISNTLIASQAPLISTSSFTANSLTFTATSTLTEISFENTTSGTGGNDNTVDVSNVVLNAVPLPTSLGLLGLGTVGLGMVLLKRRADGLAVL